MTKSNISAATDAQLISETALFRKMSELISLRERVEQAELAARIYGKSILLRRAERTARDSV